MKRGETYSSGWLKAQDMLDQGKLNGMDLTIKSVTTSTMDDGKVQRVLAFNEDDRELGLNVTNWDSIAGITSQDDDEHWIGSVVNVHPIKLDRPYNGKTHGLRVRSPQGIGPARANGHAPAPAPTRPAPGMNWEDAVTAVLEAGLADADWRAHVKGLGLTKWNASTGAKLVQDFIASHKAAVDEDIIPF